MNTQEIVDQITKEREYQKAKWGSSDYLNNEFNWGAYITAYATRSLIGHPGDRPERVEAFKRDMIKVATLAIAALETL